MVRRSGVQNFRVNIVFPYKGIPAATRENVLNHMKPMYIVPDKVLFQPKLVDIFLISQQKHLMS